MSIVSEHGEALKGAALVPDHGGPMILFHSTSEAGRAAIEAEGFAVSHFKGSAGKTWFAGSRDSSVATGHRVWWVLVDIPNDIAEQYMYRFDDGRPYLQSYLIPFEIVNACRPFRYERWA